MSISERMFKLLEEKNKKSVDLAAVLDVGTGQISTWKKRNTDPPSKYISKICEFLDVSYEYLLTGKESSTSLTSTEDAEWLSLIHQLPTEAQHEFRGELKGYLKRLNEESVAADEPLKKTGTTNFAK